MPIRLSTFFLCVLWVNAPTTLAQSDAAPSKAAAQVLPARPSATATNDNSGANNDKDKTIGTGCSRADWLAHKCSTYPGSAPPIHRRPIIIVPQQSTPPIDDTPLASDWEGCRTTKLNQLRLTQNGNLDRAKQLDEWLWKNCRSYSQDLRQLEQDQM